MKLTLAVIAAMALTLAACGKKDEPPKPKVSEAPSTAPAGVSVTTITLGNEIGPEKKVVRPTDSFAKNDTVYASVDTVGSGTSTLQAKWTYRANGQDMPVRDDSQTINTVGAATSEFHVSKPDGWPPGDYNVEISASGNSSGSRAFTVK